MSTLSDWFSTMDAAQKDLMLGRETADPLHDAFEGKRTVHAGNPGTPIMPDDAQNAWRTILHTVPEKREKQLAYIHIPFCQTKCLYCGFFQNQSEQAAEDQYVKLLIQELEAASGTPRMENSNIHAVFIGGGTPTSLSPANAKALLEAIHKYLPLTSDCELTLEGRIHDLVPEKMDVWMAGGVNRMSLGVQSFHTKIRRQLGRIDDGETVVKNLAALKAYQQCAVIVDLIYGLPDQTMDIWTEDLAMLETAEVDGMDLYQLNVFDDCELDRRIRDGRISPAANTKEQADMYAAAADFVGKRAFKKLSVRHWSRSPRERSLYNILVKEGVPLFPFGSGAGGGADGYSCMLHRSLTPYEMMVRAGKKPIMGMMSQDASQPLVNVVMHQIEQGYFDPAAAARVDPVLDGLRWLWDLWCERGLAENNGVLYRLTTAGEFWQVNLAQTVQECIKKLTGGTPAIVHDKVAAQNRDSEEIKGKKGPSSVVLSIRRATGASEEEAEKMAAAMPPHIRQMLEAMPPAMIDMAARNMGADMMKEMIAKAKKK